MTKEERLLKALQSMQQDCGDCSDLEIAYLGYVLIQTAAVIHGIPVEKLLLNAAANVDVECTDTGVDVSINVGEDDDND